MAFVTVNGRKLQSFRQKSGVYRITTTGEAPAQLGFVLSRAWQGKGKPPRDAPLRYGFRVQTLGDEPIDEASYQGEFTRFADCVSYLLTAYDRGAR
jgi:hypothetical protein